MEYKANILLIEDEEGLVLSLTDRLENEGYTVKSVRDGLEGEKEALTGNDWDLVLLDIMLPGKDGFQICQAIRNAGRKLPILMLTARNTTIDTVLGLRLGADDYLAKPFEMQILLARINALLRRARYEPEEKKGENGAEIFAFGEFSLDVGKQELKQQDQPVPLNAQEFRLLCYFLRHPERVIDRQELLDEVWGYDKILTTRTVDVHVAWLRQKLGEQNVPRHIRTIRGTGYKFLAEG